MERITSRLPAVLLVDDVDANLIALDAVLEPLDVDVLRASSGDDALVIMEHEADRIALTLIDVQMPAMDGFEVAAHMREDEQLASIPIMFLTAHDSDRSLAMRGYASGAVDYISKPFDPDEFREKVRAMLDIDAERRSERERTISLLRDERRRGTIRLEQLERARVREYHRLANSLPAIVWTTDESGAVDFCSDRFTDQLHVDVAVLRDLGWHGVVHVDDLPRWLESRARAFQAREPHTIECRLGTPEAGYRLFQLRELPRVDEDGTVSGWVGSGLDIEDQRGALAHRIVAEVGQVLEGSIDWRSNLSTIPQLLVPALADWCAVVIDGHWSLRWTAGAPGVEPPAGFADREGSDFLGLQDVLTTGAPRFLPSLDLPGAVGFGSGMAVAIQERGDIYGALVLLTAGTPRRFDLADLELATRIAERLAATVRVGDLYDQARAGADSALVLGVVGDGVMLVDASGVVRVWNAAAERITHLAAADVVGLPAASAIPWWEALEPRIPIAIDDPVEAESLPAGDPASTELWLSISGVDFGRGRAYAFRDASAAHRLERLQSDFIATVSHELRTPLASIAGAAETMNREDIELDEETRTALFDVISHQSRRLASLVDDVLMVGRIGGTDVQAEPEPVDVLEVARQVIDTAALNAPENIHVAVVALGETPRVRADRQMLQQVLTNLVDNAVKYSPSGGRVDVTLEPRVRTMRISVADEGIGIGEADIDDIFSKFFRVDAGMASGIGGTGLGLYIVRELVERMQGTIRVQSRLRHGTTFVVELPLVESVIDAHGRAGVDGATSDATRIASDPS
jgi:two-component system phosphate regulon sensor histidine kinase PhoR